MNTAIRQIRWLIFLVTALFFTVASSPSRAIQNVVFDDSSPFMQGHVFAGVGNGLIHHYDANGNLLGVLDTGLGSGVYTTGCAFDSAGNLYVTTFNGGNVSRFSGPDAPHVLDTFGSSYSGSPESIVFDANGNVYVGAVDGDNDIRKFDATGSLLAQFDVAIEDRGADWIDLMADQRTMYYTSEGKRLLRYDVVDGNQLTDFTSNLPGSHAFALRILPDGGVLVADHELILRLDSSGSTVWTYDIVGDNYWFALNLDPDGTSFWSGDVNTGEFHKFDIAQGGDPLLTVDTGVGSGQLWGLCVYEEITSGMMDSDGDGLPDDWEANGVDTNGDGMPDLFLDSLDEVGQDVPPNPQHKDVYVWVDWLVGQGHTHEPEEEALLEVKEAFSQAPVSHLNPDGEPGINLHIVLGYAIAETPDLVTLGSWIETGDQLVYDSHEFSDLKWRFLQGNGANPGMAGVFHYSIFAHRLPTITLPCPTRTGSPSGIAPMINETEVGSDFIVAHGALDGEDSLVVGGTFMHELGHTLNLGHGGPGIFNDVNYKPNQLSVMNYSFQSGLFYGSPSWFKTRSTLDYSRFASETIPDLNEHSLDERIGLNGGEAIEMYGTVYYLGYPDKTGQVVHFPNRPINWNGHTNIPFIPEASVIANINSDDDDGVVGCQEKYDTLTVANEWIALEYDKGSIGTVAGLILPYPSETFVDVHNVDLVEDILDVTDGIVIWLPAVFKSTEK